MIGAVMLIADYAFGGTLTIIAAIVATVIFGSFGPRSR